MARKHPNDIDVRDNGIAVRRLRTIKKALEGAGRDYGVFTKSENMKIKDFEDAVDMILRDRTKYMSE